MEKEIESIEEIINNVECEMRKNGSNLEKLTILEETKIDLGTELKAKMKKVKLQKI